VEFEKDVIAILAHDVTKHVQSEVELRLARDALYHRDRLQVIGQVASGVAHDLNNALNVMRLRLELLRLKASSQEHQPDLAAFAQIIDAAAARVARMQDLSRKQLEATIEPLDLRRVVEEAIALAQTQFEQHSLADGRHFRISCKIGKLPSIRADVAELEHLFVNLLLNARDAMPKGGEISIHARREGNYAVVTVADEGTGIPADHLERIFDSFFTTKGKEGTGLGLAMARGTMARLGGTIHARNREHGAEFTLRFPLSLEAPAPAKPAAPVATVEEPIRRDLRILLVDDDADCREVTQAVLEGEGLTVETARSGATALEMLSRNTYDLLLCDVGMPEMSGWQVAQEARQLRPAMAIYMVTGWAGQFESADSHRDDADGILGKPLQMDELRSVIARIGAGTAPNAHAQA
jgi:CheY-like chemotaxis protein